MQNDAPPQNGTAVIPWIMRRDLETSPADDNPGAWTIRDPVRLTYFRVETEELEFLRMLNGRLSLESAAQRLMHSFPDVQFAAHNLTAFLATAIRAGLLIPTDPGYGPQLAAMAHQARLSAVWRKLFSLISHRFRGIDPDSLLQTLDHRLGWIYHRQVLTAAALFVITVACLVLSRWSQLLAELPSVGELLTPHTLLTLGIAVVLIKIVHELGHGLTCVHYGGECHELGCIVVGILPLLYCDVSDSWRQRNPLRRMQVAAAGIAVELFLAAVFGVLWLASIPGLAHSVFLNVMLLCSLNTILINGNPLLRYDGYYVLSDLLRLPNLGPESRQAALALFDRIVLGLHHPGSESLSAGRRLGLAAFGAASAVYRLLVLGTILLFVHGLLKPYRLEGLTWILAASAAAGMLFAMQGMIRQRLHQAAQSRQQALRAFAGLILLGVLPAVGLFWPLPYSIDAPFTLTPGVSSPVYVSTAGHLESSLSYGDRVNAGQTVARLTNPDLSLEVARLQGELRLRETRVAHLTSLRRSSSSSAMAIPAAEKAVQNMKARLQTLQQKATRLTLHSPAAGTLYPPRLQQTDNHVQLQQQFWQGTPLTPENKSAWLTEQTLLGWAGTDDQLRTMIFVPQQEIEFVKSGAVVRLQFHSRPGSPLRGNITRIRRQPAETAPMELVASGLLAVKAGDTTLADTRFPAYAQLDTNDAGLPPLYATGTASIECRRTSLAARCWRLVVHTFAFEM